MCGDPKCEEDAISDEERRLRSKQKRGQQEQRRTERRNVDLCNKHSSKASWSGSSILDMWHVAEKNENKAGTRQVGRCEVPFE